MAELENIFGRLEKIFKAIKIKYVIVGGIAVIHYGHVRTTQDIDIILEDDNTKFTKLLGLLKKYDFDINEDQFFSGYKEKSHIAIFDNKSHLRLDVKIADKKAEIEVLKNAIPEKLLGYSLYIAPLEYILIGKILYIGKIDDIKDSELYEYQNIFDFLTIYHANKEKIDHELLNKKVKELGLESTLKRLKSIKL